MIRTGALALKLANTLGLLPTYGNTVAADCRGETAAAMVVTAVDVAPARDPPALEAGDRSAASLFI